MTPQGWQQHFAAEVEARHDRALRISWVERGGHICFPSDPDLGFGPQFGLVLQILAFFRSIS